MIIRPIRTEADYEQALREIEAFMGALPDTDAANRLVLLVTAQRRTPPPITARPYPARIRPLPTS